MLGQLGWTIEPNSEAAGYGDDKPRKPWRVKVVQVLDRGFVKVCCYNDDTEEVDDDTNASAFIESSKFFFDLPAANAAYIKKMLRYLRGQASELVDGLNLLQLFVTETTPHEDSV